MSKTAVLMIEGELGLTADLSGLYFFPSCFLCLIVLSNVLFFSRSEPRARIPEPASMIKRPPPSVEIPHFRQKISQKIIQKKIDHKGYNHRRGQR